MRDHIKKDQNVFTGHPERQSITVIIKQFIKTKHFTKHNSQY